MAENLSHALEERWADYRRFHQGGARFTAFVKLAEIAHCSSNATLPPWLAQKWRATIQNVPITDEGVRSVRTAVAEEIKRLQRIVGVGTRFIYEEMLLLMHRAGVAIGLPGGAGLSTSPLRIKLQLDRGSLPSPAQRAVPEQR